MDRARPILWKFFSLKFTSSFFRLIEETNTHAINRSQIVSSPLQGKVSAQPHTIVKQICFPNGNVLFLSLFSLSKNWMHNVGWGCAEILPSYSFKTTKSDHCWEQQWIRADLYWALYHLSAGNSKQVQWLSLLKVTNRRTVHIRLRFLFI